MSEQMGTRSILRIYESSSGTDTEICTLYRQFDGYPSSAGSDIKEILADKMVTNGIQNAVTEINGASDGAVRLISGLKGPVNEAGNFYLHPPGMKFSGISYTYSVFFEVGHAPKLRVSNYGGDLLYDGDVNTFDPDACESECE